MKRVEFLVMMLTVVAVVVVAFVAMYAQPKALKADPQFNIKMNEPVDIVMPITGGKPPYTCKVEPFLEDGVTPSKMLEGLTITSDCHLKGTLKAIPTQQIRFRFSIKDAAGATIQMGSTK